MEGDSDSMSLWFVNWTKLHFACDQGLAILAAGLIEDGVDINARTEKGSTPLLIACRRRKSLECVRLLIAAGADVNLPDKRGWTPLHFACYADNTQAVNLLLQAGANISLETIDQRLPIDLTANIKIKNLIEGLGGGVSLKAATS